MWASVRALLSALPPKSTSTFPWVKQKPVSFFCQRTISLARVFPQGRQTKASKFVQTTVNQSAKLIGLETGPRLGEGGPTQEGAPSRVLPALDSGSQPRPELSEEGQGDGQVDSGSVGPATGKMRPALHDPGHFSTPSDRRNEPAQAR